MGDKRSRRGWLIVIVIFYCRKIRFDAADKHALLQGTVMKQLVEPQFTAKQIGKLSRLRPTLAMILGSGFQQAVSGLEIETEIPYKKLPGFPPVGVSGHAGKLLLGVFGRIPVVVLSGRAHFYEGHAMEQVTFAVRMLAELGVQDVLLTNAAGGINRRFRPGDFMVLTDHINLMRENPLRGPVSPKWPRFVDMTRTYDAGLSALLHKAAKKCKMRLQKGVYVAVSGPNYETPAEIEAFARLGADAVGMSTVPEAIVARQCGMKVAGLSCITNLAAGRGGGKTLSHAEVLETADNVKHAAGFLLQSFAHAYGESE